MGAKVVSAPARGNGQGACRLGSQDQWNFSRRSTEAAPVQLLRQKDLKKRHKGNDIGMVDDFVTVVVSEYTAKTTKRTEHDPVMKALPENDPDTVVTLSATVTEQGADTKADVDELTRFSM